jgi:glycosyl transferase family 25
LQAKVLQDDCFLATQPATMKMDVFLINLGKDTDRLAAMHSQLSGLSIPYERIEAVYGTRMPDKFKPYFLDDQGRIASSLLPGEVGCYASHLVIMDRVAKGESPALVLEDDLQISDDFVSVINAIDGLPADWDIVRLSNPYKRGYVISTPLTHKYQAVKFINVSPSTGAYMITPKGAKKFLSWRQLRTRPVDQDLRRVWDCKLVTYGVFPRPIVPDVGSSSIDGMVKRRAQQHWRRRSIPDELSRIAYNVHWLGVRAWMRHLIYSKHYSE